MGALLHVLSLVGLLLAWQPTHLGFALALSIAAATALWVYAAELYAYPALAQAPKQTPWLLLACASAALPAVLSMWSQDPAASSAPAPRASAAATLHWVLGLASYGLILCAAAHALLLSRLEAQLRAGQPQKLPMLQVERLMFGQVYAGFVLLSASLALGFFMTPQATSSLGSLGSAAGSSHKLVFALTAWAVFAALIGLRLALGVRGAAARRWVYTGTAALLLAYVGTHFVLQMILQRSA